MFKYQLSIGAMIVSFVLITVETSYGVEDKFRTSYFLAVLQER